MIGADEPTVPALLQICTSRAAASLRADYFAPCSTRPKTQTNGTSDDKWSS